MKMNKKRQKIKDGKRGRKSILIELPEVKEKLLHAIRLGTNYVTACGYAGIDYRNHFRNWVEHAEEEINRPKGIRQKYKYLVDFWMELQEAKSEGEIVCLENIRSAGLLDWKAFAWLLARRYGYTEKTVIEGGDKPIQIENKTELISDLLAKFPDKDKKDE